MDREILRGARRPLKGYDQSPGRPALLGEAGARSPSRRRPSHREYANIWPAKVRPVDFGRARRSTTRRDERRRLAESAGLGLSRDWFQPFEGAARAAEELRGL